MSNNLTPDDLAANTSYELVDWKIAHAVVCRFGFVEQWGIFADWAERNNASPFEMIKFVVIANTVNLK